MVRRRILKFDKTTRRLQLGLDGVRFLGIQRQWYSSYLRGRAERLSDGMESIYEGEREL